MTRSRIRSCPAYLLFLLFVLLPVLSTDAIAKPDPKRDKKAPTHAVKTRKTTASSNARAPTRAVAPTRSGEGKESQAAAPAGGRPKPAHLDWQRSLREARTNRKAGRKRHAKKGLILSYHIALYLQDRRAMRAVERAAKKAGDRRLAKHCRASRRAMPRGGPRPAVDPEQAPPRKKKPRSEGDR